MTLIDAHEWLIGVKDILIQEGFATTPLQINKPGQVFGLVKKLDDDWQWHVRGFNDDRLESHIEVSNDFLEHLKPEHRRAASHELTQLLEDYGMSCEITGDLPVMDVVFRPPEKLTPWKLPAAIIAGTILLSWLSKKSKR